MADLWKQSGINSRCGPVDLEWVDTSILGSPVVEGRRATPASPLQALLFRAWLHIPRFGWLAGMMRIIARGGAGSENCVHRGKCHGSAQDDSVVDRLLQRQPVEHLPVSIAGLAVVNCRMLGSLVKS